MGRVWAAARPRPARAFIKQREVRVLQRSMTSGVPSYPNMCAQDKSQQRLSVCSAAFWKAAVRVAHRGYHPQFVMLLCVLVAAAASDLRGPLL